VIHALEFNLRSNSFRRSLKINAFNKVLEFSLSKKKVLEFSHTDIYNININI